MINYFHKFNVTSSYEELRRCCISAAQSVAKNPQGASQFSSENGLVQVVVDNFDAQIASQNGQKATHGIAMIVTQSGQPKPGHLQQINEIPKIKHLKQEETKACQLELADVEVQCYNGPNKPNMPEKYKYKVVPPLHFLARQKVSINRAILDDLEFLMAVISQDPCPEYGGFNTKRARESGKQPEQKTGIM